MTHKTDKAQAGSQILKSVIKNPTQIKQQQMLSRKGHTNSIKQESRPQKHNQSQIPAVTG